MDVFKNGDFDERPTLAVTSNIKFYATGPWSLLVRCQVMFFCFMLEILPFIFSFQLKAAIKSAEAGREDLEDRLAEMMDKLRGARAKAEEAVSRHVTEWSLLLPGFFNHSPLIHT